MHQAPAQPSPVQPAPYTPPARPAYGETGPADAPHRTAAYPAVTESFDAFGQPAPAQSAPPEPAPQRVGAGMVVAIMVAAALVGGAAGLGGAAIGSTLLATGSGTVVQSGPTTVTVNDTDDVTRTTGIATKVLPSVVTISASTSSGGGTGSGVVLSDDGYVVTNTHVVTLDGATGSASLSVTTSDGKVYDATIVGTDPVYDLAVIKLDGATGLTPIEFADSSGLNVGDATVAVGAPLGLSNTVTTGIVSALNRSIQIASSAAPDTGDTQEDDGDSGSGPFQFDFGQGQQQVRSSGTISIAVIQTDAAINPGNSGGALVDADGKLIGINVAIATAGSTTAGDAAGSIGVGFSIPSNIVERVSGEIIDNGSATHGLLGAMVGDAAVQEGATTTGAYISDVTPGGAAAEAGLAAGDVVTQFNGFPIADATDLTAQVRAAAAGTAADVVYIRDGETASVQVTLGELDG
ncbi:trypsin-like peptidase domain-containing protein [Microbacterium sp.]|uniref:S1C family serine protease n=1 Tax=Microbacterium sp. TaxID=51671 RepID=UPI003A8C51B7